jgi:hypothetical protein
VRQLIVPTIWGREERELLITAMGARMKIARTVLSGAVLAAAFALSAGNAGAAGNGLGALATAGYQVTFGGQLRTVEFAAQRDSSNTSRGQGHLFNHVTGTKIHFVIDCLNVVGNVATISGAISNTDTALFPDGTPIWLQVIDNGERRTSPPDLVSPLFAIVGPPLACTTPISTATIPIEGGNVQVH